MKSFFSLAAFFCFAFLAMPCARAEDVTGTNAPPAQLAGLAQAAMKLGVEADLPAKLTGLLWPATGTNQQKCTVKRIALAGKRGAEGRYFCLRPDNQDIVLVYFTNTKPDAETKIRKEFYYRTTVQGNLVLALTATFQFAIDDVDNEILKKTTQQTYGEVVTSGAKPLPVTPDITEQFEAEKKLWLAQEKKLKKMGRKK